MIFFNLVFFMFIASNYIFYSTYPDGDSVVIESLDLCKLLVSFLVSMKREIENTR